MLEDPNEARGNGPDPLTVTCHEAEAEVRAAAVALSGVQKEAQGGQRTTLDVLNSQQELTAARARLIGAQRDRVIATYTLLAATGRLEVKTCAMPGAACVRRRDSRRSVTCGRHAQNCARSRAPITETGPRSRLYAGFVMN